MSRLPSRLNREGDIFEIQVHRRAAEIAEESSYDPIGRRRLDHKLSPFGNRFRKCFIAIRLKEIHVRI
ncbi:MAG: hypothetical protein A2W09_04735 [Deltaproteobacteria bacterium RBG_16_50_11]|nr:MAG: hypothetical protein A2W09_04735 [Deltaproteobacteria bacterium RBG_16_50_11]